MRAFDVVAQSVSLDVLVSNAPSSAVRAVVDLTRGGLRRQFGPMSSRVRHHGHGRALLRAAVA
jgi:hypothetical protein